MSVLTFLGNIFKPAADLVDNLHTSEEEKGKLRNEFVTLQNNLAMKVMEYEVKVIEMQASIIAAEAKGESWLQRTWRPITMMTFLVLTVADAFGLLPFRLAAEAWTMLQLGLGGYVIGRTAEKVVPQLVESSRK